MLWQLWPRWTQTPMPMSADTRATTSGFPRGSGIVLKYFTIYISLSIFIPLLLWVFLHTCAYAYCVSENVKSEMLWNSIIYLLVWLHEHYTGLLLPLGHIHNPENQKFWAPSWWHTWKTNPDHSPNIGELYILYMITAIYKRCTWNIHVLRVRSWLQESSLCMC